MLPTGEPVPRLGSPDEDGSGHLGSIPQAASSLEGSLWWRVSNTPYRRNLPNPGPMFSVTHRS